MWQDDVRAAFADAKPLLVKRTCSELEKFMREAGSWPIVVKVNYRNIRVAVLCGKCGRLLVAIWAPDTLRGVSLRPLKVIHPVRECNAAVRNRAVSAAVQCGDAKYLTLPKGQVQSAKRLGKLLGLSYFMGSPLAYSSEDNEVLLAAIERLGKVYDQLGQQFTYKADARVALAVWTALSQQEQEDLKLELRLLV